MTAIDGDGDPITFGVLDTAIISILDCWEQVDVYDVCTLLEEGGICADIEDIEASFRRIGYWREDE